MGEKANGELDNKEQEADTEAGEYEMGKEEVAKEVEEVEKIQSHFAPVVSILGLMKLTVADGANGFFVLPIRSDPRAPTPVP